MKIMLMRVSATIPLLLAALVGCGASGDQPDQSVSDSLPVQVVQEDLASGVTSVEGLAQHGQLAVLATARTSRQEPNEVDPTIVATI